MKAYLDLVRSQDNLISVKSLKDLNAKGSNLVYGLILENKALKEQIEAL